MKLPAMLNVCDEAPLCQPVAFFYQSEHSPCLTRLSGANMLGSRTKLFYVLQFYVHAISYEILAKQKT